MRPLVREQFIAFLSSFEPLCHWMHLDRSGQVVVGPCCSLEPLDRALNLQWTDRQGRPISDANLIASDWVRVKRNRLLAHQGAARAAPFTNLLLSPPALEHLILGRLDVLEKGIIVPLFRTWEDWPAPAQLATLSMAWIDRNIADTFPRWQRAARNHTWRTCARECNFATTGRPELVARNHASQRLFEQAFECVMNGVEPSTLLPVEAESGPDAA